MSDKIKNVMKITAIGLSLAVDLSVAVLAFPRKTSTPASEPSDLGDMTVDVSDGEAVSLTAVEISPENFADYGIMPIAEKGYRLTATVNADATVKAVDWTIEFQNPASVWATGKTATDYVSFSWEGKLTATVICTQAFGEPILVSAVSKDDPRAKATCTCDYRSRIVGAVFEATSNVSEHSFSDKKALPGSNLGKIFFGETYSFVIDSLLGDGTRDPGARFYFSYMTLTIPSEVVTELSKKGFACGDVGQKVVRIEFTSPVLTFDVDFLSSLFGSDAATDRKALSEAIKALSGTYPNLIETHISFNVDGGGYDGPTGFDFYFDIDGDSIYTPVSSVEVNESNVLF